MRTKATTANMETFGEAEKSTPRKQIWKENAFGSVFSPLSWQHEQIQG
jgi:hypothetical protein